MTDLGVRGTDAVTDAAAMVPTRDIRSPRRAGRAGREFVRWVWGVAGILAIVLIW
jgi:hypothetical protein